MNDYLGDIDINTGIVKEDNMGNKKSLSYYELLTAIQHEIMKSASIKDEEFKISMPTSDMYGQYVGLTYDIETGRFYLS